MNAVQNVFREYYSCKDNVSKSIDSLKCELGDMIDSIVLYGAGSAGIAFIHYLRDCGIYPRYFADGNPDRWGHMLEGIEIIDYHAIPDKLGSKALVIVTINTDGVKYCKSFDEALRKDGHKGVHRNLHEAGCDNVVDYTYFRRYRELFRGDKYNLPACSDVYEMEANEEQIYDAYELLADDESREIYEGLVRFRLVDDTVRIPTEPQDRQYFEYEFFDKREDEVFVDCGAYNGISLKTFLKENNDRFLHYYGIEPDAENYRKLNDYVGTLPKDINERITLINKCAFDADTDLRLYALSGPGSFLSDEGCQPTRGVRIDDIVDERGATFIKMNIEGSEIYALRGAVRTLGRCRPRLAIAGYHKTGDLWRIPLMIHEANSSYRLHLRSYMNNISFIYYAA